MVALCCQRRCIHRAGQDRGNCSVNVHRAGLQSAAQDAGADKIAIRASLCASQLVGLGIMRYGVRSEPLHSMSVEALVDAIGPTMQRYLVGNIG